MQQFRQTALLPANTVMKGSDTVTNQELFLAMSDLFDKKLDAKLQPIKNDIKSIQEEQIRINGKLIVIEKEIADIKEDINDIKDDINGIKDEINGIKEDINGIKDDINDIKDDINDIKDDINDIKDDINGIKERLTIIEKKQDIFEKRLDTMDSKLTKFGLIIENNIQPSINILSENYVPMARKFSDSIAQIEAIQVEQDIIKKVLHDHGEKLKRIS